MHVLHLSTAITWRGGEQQIAYLYQGLQQLGIQQTVLCSSQSALLGYCNKYSLPCHHVPKSGSFSLAYARKIKELAVAQRVDLIHIHDSHAHNNAVLAATLLGVKTPMVLHRRVDFAVSSNFLSRYKYNHPRIQRIISVSLATQQVLAPAIKDHDKLRMVHSGIDTSREIAFSNTLKTELGLPENAVVIGNAAALADHKDPYTFLRVAEILKDHPQFYFVWIGGGEMEAEVRAAITQMGLQKRVFLTGFKSDVKDLLAEFSVFLMTSKTEGLGTSILDAYLAGVPVVATAAGGIPELVEHGQTGLLAPVGDAETLAMHILHLTVDPPFAARLAHNAKERVKGFDYHIMAEKVMGVYREVL